MTTALTAGSSPYDQVSTSLILVCRVGIFITNAISFWTTAVGLTGFVFSSFPVALAFSFALQMMLVVFDFSLPNRRMSIKKLFMYLLYLVVLTISAGFSYVYISNDIYRPIWSDTVQETVLSEYRAQLYENQEFVEQFLEEEIGLLNGQITAVAHQSEADRQADQAAQSTRQTAQAHLEEAVGSLELRQFRLAGDRYYTELAAAAPQVDAALEAGDSAATQQLLAQLTQTGTELSDSLAAVSQSANTATSQAQAAYAAYRTALLSNALASSAGADAAQRSADRLNEQKMAYDLLYDCLRTMLYMLDNYRSSDSGSVNAAVYELQRQMLEAVPDEAVMQQQVGVLIDYAQKKAEEGNGSDYAALVASVADLNRRVQDYKALVEVNAFLKEEADALADASQSLQDRLDAAEGQDEGAVVQSFWLDKVQSLRNKLALVPSYTGDTGTLQAHTREATAAELDSLISRYLVENTRLRQAINFFWLPLSCRWEAYVAVLMAFTIDIIPFGLNHMIVWIKHSSPSTRKKREKAETSGR